MPIKISDGVFDYAHTWAHEGKYDTFLELYVPGEWLYIKERDLILKVEIGSFTFYCMQLEATVKNRVLDPHIIYIMRPNWDSSDLFSYYCNDDGEKKATLIYSTWITNDGPLRKKLYAVFDNGTTQEIDNDHTAIVTLLDTKNREKSKPFTLQPNTHYSNPNFTFGNPGIYIKNEEFALQCGSFTATYPTSKQVKFMTHFEGPHKNLSEAVYKVYDKIETDETWGEAFTTNNPWLETGSWIKPIFNPNPGIPALSSWSLKHTKTLTYTNSTSSILFSCVDDINYEPHGANFITTKHVFPQSTIYITHRCYQLMTPYDLTQGWIHHLFYESIFPQDRYRYIQQESQVENDGTFTVLNTAYYPTISNMDSRYIYQDWVMGFLGSWNREVVLLYESGYYDVLFGTYQFNETPLTTNCTIDLYLDEAKVVTTLEGRRWRHPGVLEGYNVNMFLVSAKLRGPSFEYIGSPVLYDPNTYNYNTYVNEMLLIYTKDGFSTPRPNVPFFKDQRLKVRKWGRNYTIIAYPVKMLTNSSTYINGCLFRMTTTVYSSVDINTDVEISITLPVYGTKSIIITHIANKELGDNWRLRDCVNTPGTMAIVSTPYVREFFFDLNQFGFGLPAGNIWTILRTGTISAKEITNNIPITIQDNENFSLDLLFMTRAEDFVPRKIIEHTRSTTYGGSLPFVYNVPVGYSLETLDGARTNIPERTQTGFLFGFFAYNMPQINLVPSTIIFYNSGGVELGRLNSESQKIGFETYCANLRTNIYPLFISCVMPGYGTSNKSSYGTNVYNLYLNRRNITDIAIEKEGITSEKVYIEPGTDFNFGRAECKGITQSFSHITGPGRYLVYSGIGDTTYYNPDNLWEDCTYSIECNYIPSSPPVLNDIRTTFNGPFNVVYSPTQVPYIYADVTDLSVFEIFANDPLGGPDKWTRLSDLADPWGTWWIRFSMWRFNIKQTFGGTTTILTMIAHQYVNP